MLLYRYNNTYEVVNEEEKKNRLFALIQEEMSHEHQLSLFDTEVMEQRIKLHYQHLFKPIQVERVGKVVYVFGGVPRDEKTRHNYFSQINKYFDMEG